VTEIATAPKELHPKRFGDGADQYAYDLAVSPSGDITLFGNTQGAVNFGGADITDAMFIGVEIQHGREMIVAREEHSRRATAVATRGPSRARRST